MSWRDLLVVAGEASGDLHGARLISELGRQRPAVRPFGLGGGEMEKAGFEALASSHEISVVGLTEALSVVPRAYRIYRRLLAEAERRDARAAVLIDSPELNLRLAGQLHRRGVRVIYYISPQVWAWRKGRVRTIAERVDRMLVLFPFEVDFYRRHGVEVVHVGHPLVDEIPRLEQVWERGAPAGGESVISLLPGSRASEVRALLPIMLASVARLAERLPIRVRLIQSRFVAPELIDRLSAASGVEVERVRDRDERFAAIAGSHLALCASGTATVEVGLLGTPMIVVYRLALWTYHMARYLVDLPHASMVNLVLGDEVVPELLQDDAEPEKICAEAERLLGDPERIAVMRRALGELRPRLGPSGASRRAALEVARILDAEDGR